LVAPTKRVMAASLGEDADHLGARLDLANQPLQRIGGVQFCPVLDRADRRNFGCEL
jgi:hypothetical protein